MHEAEVLDVADSVQFLRTEALFATSKKAQSLLEAARLLERMEKKLGQAYCVAASLHWDGADMSDEEVARCLEYILSDTYDDVFEVVTSSAEGANAVTTEFI